MDWTSAALWASLLAGLRASPADFALRPDRWPTRAPIPMVESVLAAPLTGPAAVDALGGRLESSADSAGLIRAAFAASGLTPAPAAPIGTVSISTDVPKEIAAPVTRLVSRLAAANVDLKKAVDSLSPEDRVRALRAADDAIGDDPFLRPDGADFDAALRFDRARMAAAGIAAAEAADEFISQVKEVPAFTARWETDFGTVIVSSGDAEFGPEDLARAGLILRLGGRTRYAGPAAAAGEGQLRVVLDLGGPAVLDSAGPAGGSGVFGVGLFYLLGPGPKTLSAGPDSLGAARFGVGAAVVAGDGSALASRRFSQGAAAFGAALLETRGDKLTLKLPLAGQGYATTLGAGFWRHRGDGLSAACGFEYPDAREPLGSVSMGQGAGMGPRAFAAGGVGAALVEGDDAALSGSYFAQGAGYWHGLGALYVRGARARLQSRRYGLGSGTHMAVGALDVQGSSASVTGWGVGPGFGWDYGVGLFRLRGDDARVRADWGTGRADVGGRSLSWIEGDRPRLMLSGFGTGSFARAQAGYGLAVINGKDVRMKAAANVEGTGDIRTSPWGAIRSSHIFFDSKLTLPDPVWPPTDTSLRAAAEAGKTAALMSPASNEDSRARVTRLLFAASAAILDTRPAEGAAVGLIGLGAEDAPALAALLDPERFDELTWARVAAAGLGPAAAKAAVAELPASAGVRRALLLDWARLGRAEDALPAIEPYLRDADWRARRSAAGALGGMFSADMGDEPGRRRLLRAGAAASADGVALKRLPDLYAALALAGVPTAAERLELLAKARTPFDSVTAEAIADYAAKVSSSPARAAALAAEEKDLARLLDRARGGLRAAAADRDDEVAAAALDGLGGMGLAEDAPLLASALSAFSAQRREAAAWALSRLGPAGRAAIERALKTGDARTRACAALAAARSWDQKTFDLLDLALADPDPSVRAAAVAGLSMTQRGVVKTGVLQRLKRLKDPAAALAAAAIEPAKAP